MPIVVMNKVSLFMNLVLMTAAKMPIISPKTKAMEIDTAANNKVFGKASPKTSETLRLLWYDMRR